MTIKLAILGSTRGSALSPLLRVPELHIVCIVSNRKEAGILNLAEQHHIPSYFIHPTGLSREEYDRKLLIFLEQKKIDLIVLIGYMRILSPLFIATWPHKIINVHPSLLPKHRGLMDLAVHQAVLDQHDLVTGCSVHEVTDRVDEGPVLVQKTCAVLPNDTAETLKARVQQLEGPALIQAILKKRKHDDILH